MKTEMVIACHSGSSLRSGNLIGIIDRDECLIIAFRESADCTAEDCGFVSLWESVRNMEDAEAELRLGPIPQGPGIYLVECEFDQDEVSTEDGQNWLHLADCHPEKISETEMLDVLNQRNGWQWA